MTRQPSPTTNPASQDLLRELIKEGLSTGTQWSDGEVSKYRRLFQVLVDNCLLTPSQHEPTQPEIEQADLTLNVLLRHATARPRLLYDADAAFHKWIIARLVAAASNFARFPKTLELVTHIIDCAIDIVTLLNAELSEPHSSSSKGQARSASVLIQLLDFALDASHGSPASLFDFEFESNLTTTQLCLAIVLSAQSPFTPRLRRLAIDTFVRATSLSFPDGPEISMLLSAALANGPAVDTSHLLSTLIQRVGNTSGPLGRPSFSKYIDAADHRVRFIAWTAVFNAHQSLHITNDVGARLILKLITPIDGVLRASDIIVAVGRELLSSWLHQLLNCDIPRQLLADLDRMLRIVLGLRNSGNLKRSREQVEDDENKGDILERLLPELEVGDPSAGGPLQRVRRAINHAPPQLLAKIFQHLPALLSHAQQELNDKIPDSEATLLWNIIDQRTCDDLSRCKCLHHLLDASTSITSSRILQDAEFVSARTMLIKGLKCKDRRSRLQASRTVSLVYLRSSELARRQPSALAFTEDLRSLFDAPKTDKLVLIAILGDVGRSTDPRTLGWIVESLLLQLGASDSPVRSSAYTKLLDLCDELGKTPFTLISPYLKAISIMTARRLISKPEILAEVASFIGQSRQNFLETTLQHTVPALIISTDRACLAQLASITKQSLGQILLDNMEPSLTVILLSPQRTSQYIHFLVELLRQVIDQGTMRVDPVSLMTSCIVPLVTNLIIELGDEDTKLSRQATDALQKAYNYFRASNKSLTDLGTFLRPHMLGVMTHLNETLHDLRGKKTVEYKRKLIRSLKKLIELVGGSIASYSPQIIASLQSTLASAELRRATLETFLAFTRTLRYTEIGPFIGRTTGALIAHWKELDPEDRQIGRSIIMEIADNAGRLSTYLDDIVGLEHIPELRDAAAKLTSNRKSWDFKKQLSKLMDRVKSKDIAVAVTSIQELRHLLTNHTRQLAEMTEGDSFHTLIATTIRVLLTVTLSDSGDGQHVTLCDCAYECLGIIGAVDPDRVASFPETTTMTILSNFADQDEAMDFAIHLVRDLLVDAFRATTDTRLQGYLQFAIQELLRFCQFDSRLLQPRPPCALSAKTVARWNKLPKDQSETLAPLLESRFTFIDTTTQKAQHPIYDHVPTYREWLQIWTTDLIARIMSLTSSSRATEHSQAIFGVFRGILRNQDVAIPRHILPHLVLNVLLSGDETARKDIGIEIETVLRDQVKTSTSSSDKRSLSAQVIFDLLDHLSKWQRSQRLGGGKVEKSEPYMVVEKVLTSLELELMANAALQSRAYSRALRSYEQRIIRLRLTGRPDTSLQAYFEKLHLIYAKLDEPDGMEGVSTFVLSPSLDLQIREHESTGRWTSAQSCWEVKLQQFPDDVNLHIGLLRCLKNLGHYVIVDTLRTHIRGILGLHPEWTTDLADFEAEAAWIIGDWRSVKNLGDKIPPIGQAFLALHEGRELEPMIRDARRRAGRNITSHRYSTAYPAVSELHSLREIEMISEASQKITRVHTSNNINKVPIIQDLVTKLIQQLDHRFDTLIPLFQARDEVLSTRRTAFRLVHTPQLASEIGSAWTQSAKIARKSGYEQTAYSAILQAQEADAPYAFMEKAKLLRSDGGAWKALMDLENMSKSLIDVSLSNRSGTDYARDKKMAKVSLLQARWANETERFEPNTILERYRVAIKLAPDLESPYYHLGHYYDELKDDSAEVNASYKYHTCHNYVLALQHGVKYIYQTMPRMLTLWLDLGEDKEIKKLGVAGNLSKITSLMDRSRKELATYQFLTAFPQIVSRIGHPNKEVAGVLRKIMSLVIERYPQQALWPSVGVMQSNRKDRKAACETVIFRAQKNDASTVFMIKEAERVGSVLLRLTEDKGDPARRELSLRVHFAYVKPAFPSKMIVPLQEALTCSLPSTSETVKSHNPFAEDVVEIQGIEDKVDVMSSLQRPKKLILIGSDGRRYPFLCKPHDDLRKDARLMDFNTMINKLLKSASESRRRRLYIRTYAVTPLNEECGLLEWVSNTTPYKNILESCYARHGKRLYSLVPQSSSLSNLLKDLRNQGKAKQVQVFAATVVPHFSPSVFHEWFLTTWPESSAWLSSRMAYSRTLAVMSMVGYVLGLGDRHGENILFDGQTGDTLHVDFNCLFDKGKTFEIPEIVPFRLTHNLVDALGVTGVEGFYRKAAEICLTILRNNTEALMSVLEAFAHDPLVEWSSYAGNKSEKSIRAAAERNLEPIRSKLQGQKRRKTGATSVPNQVESLIKEATNVNNLGVMYQGWAAWL